jgi:hypothetical protein
MLILSIPIGIPEALNRGGGLSRSILNVRFIFFQLLKRHPPEKKGPFGGSRRYLLGVCLGSL